jgi:N-ethylmaleimide reductase
MSPISLANDVATSEPQAQFDHIVEQLDALGIAYIHVFEVDPAVVPGVPSFDYDALRSRFSRSYIANNGYDFDKAVEAIANEKADLVSFGKSYISNPDLVERFREGIALAPLDPATLYGGGAKGYTDYPAARAEATA